MELMAVLAIVGILAAVLLPTLSAGKRRAERATCGSNLGQIDKALLMYASDNADFLRAAAKDFHIYFTYKRALGGYLGRTGTQTNDPLFACPADDFDCTIDPIEDFFEHKVAGKGFYRLRQTEHASYLFNGEAASPADGRATATKLGSVAEPSRLVLESEISGAIGLSAHERGSGRQFNNAKNMLAFVDGHVDFLPIFWQGPGAGNGFPVSYNPPAGYGYAWLQGQ